MEGSSSLDAGRGTALGGPAGADCRSSCWQLLASACTREEEVAGEECCRCVWSGRNGVRRGGAVTEGEKGGPPPRVAKWSSSSGVGMPLLNSWWRNPALPPLPSPSPRPTVVEMLEVEEGAGRGLRPPRNQMGTAALVVVVEEEEEEEEPMLGWRRDAAWWWWWW